MTVAAGSANETRLLVLAAEVLCPSAAVAAPQTMRDAVLASHAALILATKPAGAGVGTARACWRPHVRQPGAPLH